jgi:hypothetical protein
MMLLRALVGCWAAALLGLAVMWWRVYAQGSGVEQLRASALERAGAYGGAGIAFAVFAGTPAWASLAVGAAFLIVNGALPFLRRRKA